MFFLGKIEFLSPCPLAHFFFSILYNFYIFLSQLNRNKSGKVGRKPANPVKSRLCGCPLLKIKVGTKWASGQKISYSLPFSLKISWKFGYFTLRKRSAHFHRIQKWAELYSFFRLLFSFSSFLRFSSTCKNHCNQRENQQPCPSICSNNCTQCNRLDKQGSDKQNNRTERQKKNSLNASAHLNTHLLSDSGCLLC